jgi:hypothetical protein
MVPGSVVVAVSVATALPARGSALSGLSFGPFLADIAILSVIVLIVFAVLLLSVPVAVAQIGDRSLKDVVWRGRGHKRREETELTEPIRAELLASVRRRVSGQAQLIAESTGALHLRLEPAVELVRRSADVQPAIGATAGIEDAYRSAGCRLLIAGESGAGRTTQLFRLVGHLADVAEADTAAPIPLLLDLSGWTPGISIRDWVVDRLHDPNGGGYGLGGMRRAKELVDTHRFALMLDGLDEVHDTHRSACLNALNELLEGLPDTPEPPTPLVITCRTAEYEQILSRNPRSRLGHMRACTVRPLTEQDVAHNLDALGSRQPEWLRLNADEGAAARSVLRSPLLVSLAAEMADPAALLGKDREEIERTILTAYLRGQLAKPDPHCPDGDARRRLAWIAHTLRNSDIDSTTFYIEHLSARVVPWGLRMCVTAAGGLAGGLVGALVFGLAGGLVIGLEFGLVFGLVLGLFGLARALAPVAGPTRRRLVRPVASDLRMGLVGALVLGLVGALVVALELGLVGTLRRSLEHTLASALAQGLAFGSAVGSAVGVVVLPMFALQQASREAVVAGAGARVDGAWHDSKRSVQACGLGFGLVCGLMGALMGALVFRLSGAVVGASVGALAFGLGGLVFGLNEGGWFVLLQSLKRRELQRAGYLPSDPAGFLVWAAGRGVLRQVGGGFQFRHLLVRDLLADEFEVLVIDLRETSAAGRPVAVPRR